MGSAASPRTSSMAIIGGDLAGTRAGSEAVSVGSFCSSMCGLNVANMSSAESISSRLFSSSSLCGSTSGVFASCSGQDFLFSKERMLPNSSFFGTRPSDRILLEPCRRVFLWIGRALHSFSSSGQSCKVPWTLRPCLAFHSSENGTSFCASSKLAVGNRAGAFSCSE